MEDELFNALRLADRLLDVPSADPDDDLRTLARQLLRQREMYLRYQQASDPSHLAMAEERIAFLHRSLIERDGEIQRLVRSMRHARDLLSGEFYVEALGELDDALTRKSNGERP